MYSRYRRLGGFRRRGYRSSAYRRPRGALYSRPYARYGYRSRLGARRSRSRYYIGGRRY